jgi:type IV secretion system protein TrbL
MGAIRAGSAMSAGTATAYSLGQATSGETGVAGVAAGLSGVARAGAGVVGGAAKSFGERFSSSVSDSAQAGRDAAFRATGGKTTGKPANENASAAASSAGGGSAPDWARKLRSEQRMRGHAHTTTQAIKEGDRPGAGAAPDLDQEE